jgi:hypothetical protein
MPDSMTRGHPCRLSYLSSGRLIELNQLPAQSVNLIPYLQIFGLVELRGDVVLDRGQTFTVKENRVHRTTRQIGFIDTEGNFHGWYVPEEYLGVDVPQRESLRA